MTIESPTKHRPDKCGVSGCGDHCAVLHVLVEDDGGHELSGYWSDFAFRDQLKDRFHFIRWVPRCVKHHMRDVYGQRRGTDSPITGTQVELTWEAVEAHRQLTDAKAPPQKPQLVEDVTW